MVINAAYKVLKDPVARAKYDEKRRLKRAAVTPGASRSSGYRVDPAPSEDRSSFRQTSSEVSEGAPVESLTEIVNDMLGELMSSDGRRGLFEEFVSFLEGSSDSKEVSTARSHPHSMVQ